MFTGTSKEKEKELIGHVVGVERLMKVIVGGGMKGGR